MIQSMELPPVRVRSMRVEATAVRLKRALVDARERIPGDGRVRVELEADDGAIGEASVFLGRPAGSTEALRVLLESVFRPLVEATEFDEPKVLNSVLRREVDYMGSTGFASFAICCIDQAAWQLQAFRHACSLSKLLGGRCRQVPAYCTAVWLHQSRDEALEALQLGLANGFTRFKVKVGHPNRRLEEERLHDIRAWLPHSSELILDANQGFDLEGAFRIGSLAADLGALWFEEPINMGDLVGLRKLSRNLPLPLAGGERSWHQDHLRDLFIRGEVRVMQPDLRRLGGISPVLEVMEFCEAEGLTYSNHGGGRTHLELMGIAPGEGLFESGVEPPEGVRILEGNALLETALSSSQE